MIGNNTQFISLALPAFIAGILTFFAPCTFPLIPSFLSFISGSSLSDLKGQVTKKQRIRIIQNAVAYVFGFGLVFVVFGAVASLLGGVLAADVKSVMTRIGGIFVIFMGLYMLGLIRIPKIIKGSKLQLRQPKTFNSSSSGGLSALGASFFLGGAFAIGWSPCVGPIVGSILIIAASKTTLLQGALLLSIFSIGLGIPFVLISIFFAATLRHSKKINKYLLWFSRIGAVLLVFIGILLLTNSMYLLIEWGYKVFGFIGYANLNRYL